MMRLAKNTIRSVLSWFKESRPQFNGLNQQQLVQLLDGYIRLVHEGKTTAKFNDAMIDAYIQTGGQFQAYIHSIEREAQKASAQGHELVVELPNRFGHRYSSEEEFGSSLSACSPLSALSLKDDGYAVMPFQLDEITIEKLTKATLDFDYRIKNIDDSTSNGDYSKTLEHNVVTAFVKTEQLLDHETVRDLYLNSEILRSVRAYLECPRVRLRDVNMWFTRSQARASSESAQFYHFDQASIKWVKVFIFLTEVTEKNGPHWAILGSHVPGSKPRNLLERGYVRIPDQDIVDAYGKEKIREFEIQKGGILLADTNAWHKGSPVREGYRLVLEFEYTACVEQGPSAETP